MNQLAGFVILLFAALLLIVSSVTNVKVIAQGNDSSEKPSETGTIISSPIEVKKGPTIEEKKASAGECPSGQAKDWAGICYPLKECKASIFAQPGTCTQSEEEKTTGMLTGAMDIKKPATSTNTVSENCLKTTTKSGESLCLTAPTIPKVADLAYEAGVKKAIQELTAKPGKNVFTKQDVQEACASFAGDEHCIAGFSDTVRNIVLKQPGPEVKPEGRPAYNAGVKKAIEELAAKPGKNVFSQQEVQEACASFAGNDLEPCKAGFRDILNIVLKQPGPEVKPEGPVVCKGPAGTANGLSTTQPEAGCRR
ncbi:MAG: hypothetical protein WBF33_16490 [Candidatus Nitrosopolaris sp.]